MIVNNRQVEELQAIYSTNSKRQAIKSEYGDVVVKKIAGGYEVRQKPVRAKNPAPRVGTKRPRRVSQATKKLPTTRLVRRRKANVEPGYFPNPLPKASKTLLLKEYRMGLNAVAKEKHDLSKQAALSYSQGVVQAGQLLGVFSDVEAHSYRESLKKAAGI